MVPDEQKMWTDGLNGRTDERTTPKMYLSDFVGG